MQLIRGRIRGRFLRVQGVDIFPSFYLSKRKRVKPIIGLIGAGEHDKRELL